MFGAKSATVSPRRMPARASAEASLRQRACVCAQLREMRPCTMAGFFGHTAAARARNPTGDKGSKLAALRARSRSHLPGRAGAWYGRVAVAIAMAVGLLALWLIPALWLGGADYRAEVLWRQSAGRMVNAFDHARPAWFFLALLPLLLWPWAWRPQALRGLASAGLWSVRRARITVPGVATAGETRRARRCRLRNLPPAIGAGATAGVRLFPDVLCRRMGGRGGSLTAAARP